MVRLNLLHFEIEFLFVHISYSHLVKFPVVTQFLKGHVFHPVVPSLIFFPTTWPHWVIMGLNFISFWWWGISPGRIMLYQTAFHGVWRKKLDKRNFLYQFWYLRETRKSSKREEEEEERKEKKNEVKEKKKKRVSESNHHFFICLLFSSLSSFEELGCDMVCYREREWMGGQ